MDGDKIRAVARVYRKDIEITDDLPAESFEWSRSSGDAEAD